jgi:SAM-dependent methyltransferase
MIEAILTDALGAAPREVTILDIGCGNGDISSHFAITNRLFAVDTHDRRRPTFTSQFAFQQVQSACLPFDDDYFDVVLSHHVIEHLPQQHRHLTEIHRVLRPSGIAYLATPNRSSPIMQGHKNNYLVLRYRDMLPLFQSAAFSVCEYSVDVLKEPRKYRSEYGLFHLLPRSLLLSMRRFFPSHVFILTPAARGPDHLLPSPPRD